MFKKPLRPNYEKNGCSALYLQSIYARTGGTVVSVLSLCTLHARIMVALHNYHHELAVRSQCSLSVLALVEGDLTVTTETVLQL